MISRLAGIAASIVLRTTAVTALATQREPDAHPDAAQPLAMSGLEQERDDGADDENRLEAFAQDDEERLPERLACRCPAGA